MIMSHTDLVIDTPSYDGAPIKFIKFPSATHLPRRLIVPMITCVGVGLWRKSLQVRLRPTIDCLIRKNVHTCTSARLSFPVMTSFYFHLPATNHQLIQHAIYQRHREYGAPIAFRGAAPIIARPLPVTSHIRNYSAKDFSIFPGCDL
jgi:hypothetical protein